MIEAVMIWNEPNNMSHWDAELDPDWRIFGTLAKAASQAIAAERADLTRVLGGISPIDPNFVANMRRQGVLDTRLLTCGNSYTMTVSIGVVLIDPKEDLPGALARADHALYEAKRNGRNRVEVGAAGRRRA